MTTSDVDLSSALDLRPFRADDVISAELSAPPPDQETPRWRRSVVALIQGRVVGVARIALAPVTHTYFVEVDVAADHRRRGIGTALFAAVCARADRSIPVCARVMASQPWRAAFAESLGSSIIVRCPAPWIDPTGETARAWAAGQRVPAGYRVSRMADVDRERVIDGWTTYFAWAHRPFGVVRTEHLRAQWDGYARTVDVEMSMIATDRAGAVVAFSLVTPDSWQGRTFIVTETVDPRQQAGEKLVIATVAASVRALAGRGVRLVELEGHTVDPHIPALVRSLPPGGGDPMNIVQLRRPSAAESFADRADVDQSRERPRSAANTS